MSKYDDYEDDIDDIDDNWFGWVVACFIVGAAFMAGLLIGKGGL